MKFFKLIVTISLAMGLLFFACKEVKEFSFMERRLSFLELRKTFSNGGYNISNSWIKQSQNIEMVHETFKKVGYKNLINEEEWKRDWIPDLDINRSLEELCDSLEISFQNDEVNSKYYNEFWQRREKENNHYVVYRAIKEINLIMRGEENDMGVDYNVVNDTLEQLLNYEFARGKITNKKANEYLDYLVKIGLHHSAFHMISGENYKYENIKWNRDKEEVMQSLNKLEEKEEGIKNVPWIEDNTK